MPRAITRKKLIPQVLLFVVLFVTTEFGQYIYFSARTSPALIWPAAGIALAAVLLYGYEMWIPIALASLAAALWTPMSLPDVIANVAGNTLQPVVGVYLLNAMGFNPSMQRVRDAISLLIAAFFFGAISPSIFVPMSLLGHALGGASPYFVWSLSWGGQILGILIMTPLIVTWASNGRPRFIQEKWPELALMFFSLVLVSYMLFWTYWAPVTTWIALVFLMPLLWISLRANVRAMTLALFLATTIALTGTILVHPNPTVAVSQQLLSDEIVMELFAGIFLVIACVVAERRAIDLELLSSIEQLQVALEKISLEDKTKNEFIAILAHELRNPLAPIVSTLEYFKFQERDPSSLKMVTDMETHVQTMVRLLDDLLDISRVSQKKFELKKEAAQLSILIDHAVETVRPLMDSRGHTLNITLPNSAVWLNVDPVRFEQIMVNILNNAAKYTAPGGRIELTAAREHETLSLIVRDNGSGISPENLPHVFEPFRRESISRRKGGLGIGLSITKQLVEMHGGTIAAFSDGPELGSTFVVHLPLPSSIELPLSVKKPPVARSMGRGAAFKILVVDDNDAAAQGLSKLLQHKGHEVALAYSGKGALSAFSSFKPRVILLDIGLPDTDGYQIARQLRKKTKKPLTLVAVTGYGQEDDKKKAQGAGFDHHLTKPVGLADIEKMLSEL